MKSIEVHIIIFLIIHGYSGSTKMVQTSHVLLRVGSTFLAMPNGSWWLHRIKCFVLKLITTRPQTMVKGHMTWIQFINTHGYKSIITNSLIIIFNPPILVFCVVQLVCIYQLKILHFMKIKNYRIHILFK